MKTNKRIGVEIDPDVWDQFREFVKSKNRGRVRGVLSIELENALETYMHSLDDSVHTDDYGHDPDDTSEHDFKKETHTHNKNAVHQENQSAEVQPYHASINPKYVPIVAELEGYKQIHRKDFESMLTRRLHLTTDKSRREHLKTFEHLGILEPHPVVGHKILTVNPEYMHPDLL